MSYVALATDSFDSVVQFYGEHLGFPVVDGWDRSNGRGQRFNLGGLRLEILDNTRKRNPLRLLKPADRFHLVVELDDVEAFRRRIRIATQCPQITSWGAKMFQLRDPDEVAVTFLEWRKSGSK